MGGACVKANRVSPGTHPEPTLENAALAKWASLTLKRNPFDPLLQSLDLDVTFNLQESDLELRGMGAPVRRNCACLRSVVETELLEQPQYPIVDPIAHEGNAFLAAHTAIVSWHCRHHAGAAEDSARVMLRPLVRSDAPALAAGLMALSPQSRFTRFFGAVDSFSPQQLDFMCDSSDDRFAWGLVVLCKDRWVAIGVGRFMRNLTDRSRAEVALTIQDRWQGLGLASLLAFMTAHAAFVRGVTSLTGAFLSSNIQVRKMLEAMASSGARVMMHPCQDDDGATSFEVGLPLGVPLDQLSGQISSRDVMAAVAAAEGKAGAEM
jgi:hypothetical protein